jgi:16S rRNA (adenine1518-N6/adenine1519-N6)-dimethyltransferase
MYNPRQKRTLADTAPKRSQLRRTTRNHRKANDTTSPYTLAAKKSLGQHFLTSASAIRAIVAAGNVVEGDAVLEIGPGTGVLTDALLKAGAQVTALEADTRAIAILKERFHDEIHRKQLVILERDVRTISLSDLGFTDGMFKIIANIPYYLSGFLFRFALSSDIQPHTVVFLVQKEVAERVARTKKESLLSLSVSCYGTSTYIKTVPRGSFSPPPKVDSAILAITNISRRAFQATCDASQRAATQHEILEREALFFSLIHIGFGSKRQQLYKLLRKELAQVDWHDVLTHCGISHTARAEDLAIDTWLQLTKYAAAVGIDVLHGRESTETSQM